MKVLKAIHRAQARFRLRAVSSAKLDCGRRVCIANSVVKRSERSYRSCLIIFNLKDCLKIESSRLRLIRDIRIALYEMLDSFYARCSHRLMRDVRIVLYEMFASSYARHSFRSNRDVGYGRDKHFIQCWRDSLSKAG